MGSIRDQVRREAEEGSAPVISATTLQNASFRLAPGSLIHCGSASDALRIEKLFAGQVIREGLTIRALKSISLRCFWDRTFGMCARRFS